MGEGGIYTKLMLNWAYKTSRICGLLDSTRHSFSEYYLYSWQKTQPHPFLDSPAPQTVTLGVSSAYESWKNAQIAAEPVRPNVHSVYSWMAALGGKSFYSIVLSAFFSSL